MANNQLKGALADVVVEAGQEIMQAWKRRTTTDPYLIVGVFPGDPPEMIEAVYRAKAKFLHPDNRQTGDAERFKKLHEAHERIKRGDAAISSVTNLSQRVQEAIARHQAEGA